MSTEETYTVTIQHRDHDSLMLTLEHIVACRIIDGCVWLTRRGGWRLFVPLDVIEHVEMTPEIAEQD